MEKKISDRFAAMATLLVLLTPASSPAHGDSTSILPVFDIPKALDGSIIGQASDGKTCRFKSMDAKIHCMYGSGDNAEEYVAEATSVPSFPAFGSIRMGHVSLEEEARYAFLNAEAPTPVSGEVAVMFCKLTLQFHTDAGEIVWIWHDELRFDGTGQVAMVDSDGDGFGDLAVTGRWNGNMYGSNRWWTPNPYGSSYSAEERAYPARPAFGSINSAGRDRSCQPVNVRVVKLVPASGNITPSVDDAIEVWSSSSGP